MAPVPAQACASRAGWSGAHMRPCCRAAQALESQPSDLERAPQLSGRVRLHDAPLVGGEPLALHFSLPRGYPGKADPVLQVAPHVPCQLKQKRV